MKLLRQCRRGLNRAPSRYNAACVSRPPLRPPSLFQLPLFMSCCWQLYIPSAQIYGLSTPIPFHLQLIAPSASLRHLYTNTNTASLSPVRVCLMRHITANSYGNKVRKIVVIGEGGLCALPPLGLEGGREGEDMLRWDGYLRCDGDNGVGGFSVDDVLSIKVSFNLRVRACTDFPFLPVGLHHAPSISAISKIVAAGGVTPSTSYTTCGGSVEQDCGSVTPLRRS